MNDNQLQEKLFLAICGKGGEVVLDRIRKEFGNDPLFLLLNFITEREMYGHLSMNGIGLSKSRAATICFVAGLWVFDLLNLATVTPKELKRVRGVGKKTVEEFFRKTSIDTDARCY
jgi:hypothetical protein